MRTGILPSVAQLRHRFAPASPHWQRVDYWALDLETSGLNPRTDCIVSVGMVPVRAGGIRLGEAFYTPVRPTTPVSEGSLKVHHLLPGELERAPPLQAVLPEVVRRAAEGVLLVHHAPVDVGFLRAALRRQQIEAPRVPVVDTVALLQRMGRMHPDPNGSGSAVPVGLAAARAHFGLPRHEVHHALEDAIATAELFLLLAGRLAAERLRHLL